MKATDVRGSIGKGSGTSPLEAERLRRARLSVWEYEGGNLGPPHPPLERPAIAFVTLTVGRGRRTTAAAAGKPVSAATPKEQ